jgi:hypothetical protein
MIFNIENINTFSIVYSDKMETLTLTHKTPEILKSQIILMQAIEGFEIGIYPGGSGGDLARFGSDNNDPPFVKISTQASINNCTIKARPDDLKRIYEALKDCLTKYQRTKVFQDSQFSDIQLQP